MRYSIILLISCLAVIFSLLMYIEQLKSNIYTIETETSKTIKCLEQNTDVIIKEKEKQKVILYLTARMETMIAMQKLGHFVPYERIHPILNQLTLEYSRKSFTESQLDTILNYKP